MKARALGLVLLLAAGAAQAEWTGEAEYCATAYDIPKVIAACTTALNSGKLSIDEHKRTLNNRAWAHLERGDAASAQKDLLDAIALDDNGGRAMAWNNLGRAYWMEEKWIDALDAFYQALAQLEGQGGEEDIATGAGTRIDATTNLARLYDRLNQIEETRRWSQSDLPHFSGPLVSRACSPFGCHHSAA